MRVVCSRELPKNQGLGCISFPTARAPMYVRQYERAGVMSEFPLATVVSEDHR